MRPPPKRGKSCQFSLPEFTEPANNSSLLILPNCSAVISDRYPSTHLPFRNLAGFASALSLFASLYSRESTTRGIRSNSDPRDVMVPRFCFRVVIEPWCFISGSRHLRKSSRCHLSALVKRPPWDRRYSWWRPPAHVLLRGEQISSQRTCGLENILLGAKALEEKETCQKCFGVWNHVLRTSSLKSMRRRSKILM